MTELQNSEENENVRPIQNKDTNNIQKKQLEIKINKPQGKTKILGIIALFVFFCIINFSFIPAFYIIYKYIICEQNIYVILFFMIQYPYQLFFAKRQDWFCNTEFLQKSANFFRTWSLTLEEPIPEKNGMICFHPHGFLCLGFAIFSSLKGPIKVKYGFASRGLLSMPVSGMLLKFIGVAPVNAKNMNIAMKKGECFSLLPGGFEEATLTDYDESRIFIKKRKGFIKYALKYGYSIFPCYVFGENKCFYTFKPLLNLRLLLNRFKLPGIMAYSRNIIMPNNNLDLHVVCGKAIQIPKTEHPSKELINKYHQLYIEKLTELYNKYKVEFGYKDELKIY